MKKLIILLAFALPASMFGQGLEAGLLAGFSNYAGDMTPGFTRVMGGTQAAFGAFARYGINNSFTAKFHGLYAGVSGNDAKTSDAVLQERNLHFKSTIIEFGLTAEFNLLGFTPYALSSPFSPYLFLGVGVFHYNPKAEYQDEWVALQPLGTEGQGTSTFPERKKYGKLALNIPMGIGVKYAINDMWNIGLECGARKLFTDYIDDVSLSYPNADVLLAESGEVAAALSNRSGLAKTTEDLRGTSVLPKSDWYFITVLTISYNFLDNGLVGSRHRNRRKSGCPTY